jgi:thiamine biosynthesis lipoprotein ApbE
MTFFIPLLLAATLPPVTPARPFEFHHENAMGTSLALKIQAGTSVDADRAEAAALAEIDRLSKILSCYDPSSEVSQWLRTRDRAVAVSAELAEVLTLFDTWRARSNGALDASAETISRVWKAAAKRGALPMREELAAAVAKVREKHWILEGQTAAHTSDAALMLNTFTKSYVIDRAARAAMDAGAMGILVNSGGDIAMRGAMRDTVAIADPFSRGEETTIGSIETNLAVATSGNYRRGYDIAGKHYSHIVDPRSGATAEHVVSATVVAPDPVDAGALATAMSVLTPEEGMQMAALYVPAAEYLLIARDGARIASRGWFGMQSAAAAKPAGATSTHKMTVTLELARIEGQRYRRPYVAVWIEDQDKFPVRTIALWLEKTRWLPDLRTWHRADRLRALAEGNEIVSTVSSATRSPGKYTLEWDGKDAQGKALKPGKYTVCIEVAREHGTYQIIRQEIDLNGGPKQIALNGNPEVASASLDYR